MVAVRQNRRHRHGYTRTFAGFPGLPPLTAAEASIFSSSRSLAIERGSICDVSREARLAGINYPVAFSLEIMMLLAATRPRPRNRRALAKARAEYDTIAVRDFLRLSYSAMTSAMAAIRDSETTTTTVCYESLGNRSTAVIDIIIGADDDGIRSYLFSVKGEAPIIMPGGAR